MPQSPSSSDQDVPTPTKVVSQQQPQPQPQPQLSSSSSTQQQQSNRTLQLLSQFLVEEQEQRKKLRDESGLHTTWKDLQNAYETDPAVFEDPRGLLGYDAALDGAGGGGGGLKDEVDGLGQLGVDALNQTVGELSKKLSQAASFMGSPDQQLLKEQKLRKQRKKKRKDARKEAKKQAKLQAKMMMGNSNRF